MKKVAKLLSLILVLFMIAAVMFACSSDTDSDNDKDDKKPSEKYTNLSPEGVYNKMSKTKNVTITHCYNYGESEYKQVYFKNGDAFKAISYSGSEASETIYINLATEDFYEEEDGKWFYEKRDGVSSDANTILALDFTSRYGDLFKPENAYESDNYDLSENVYTFKSDLIGNIAAPGGASIISLTMTRTEQVYVFVAEFAADGETATVEITVDFNANDVKLPENAIEIKYEDYTVTVRDANGNPIKNVEVNIYGVNGDYIDWGTTDEDGKAVIENVQIGKEYYATLYYYNSDIEYVIEEQYPLNSTGGATTITLAEKEKAIYKVNLKDPDGNPISGIDVSLYTTEGYYVTWKYSDENGQVEFVFDDPADFYVQLYGSLDTYIVQEQYYFNGSTTLDINFEEKPSYRVNIKDSNGNPVESMSVNLYDANGNYIYGCDTDSEGVAKLIVEREYNFVYVTLFDYTGGQMYVIEDGYTFASGEMQLDIVLQLRKAITVKVVNNAGDPIYNVCVCLRKVGSIYCENYGYTDSEGYVRLYDFDDTAAYFITIENVPYIYSYEESYSLIGYSLTIYLGTKI